MLWLVVASMTYTTGTKLRETPVRPPVDICRDRVKKPHNPKQEPKDVQTQPYCEAVPAPKQPKRPRKVEK
jgi:hypothetical protein